jgi:nicotinate dehydrogenase subunit B
MSESINQGRRTFLVAGALVVGFALFSGPRRVWADDEVDTLGTKILAPDLPGSLRSTPFLDAWIKIDEKFGITVCTGKVELGTGVRTALLQIAAERLEVSPGRIRFITADTAQTPNEGYTAGSHSIADGGTALLNAAAQVRGLLMQSAASHWQLEVHMLSNREDVIYSPDGRSMSYVEAAKAVQLHQQASPLSPPKLPSAYTQIGQSLPRLDIPAKVSGGAAYVQDIRLAGMLHARVIRPTRRGARLLELDGDKIEQLPGVVKLIRNGNYLAVVAVDEWQAIQAMRETTRLARWSEGDAPPDSDKIHELLPQLPAKDFPVVNRGISGQPAAKVFKANFTKQYLMHASIGPSCAVAYFTGGLLTVWTHSQGVFPLRAGIAEMLSMPTSSIRCIHTEGAGCYGHNGADDAAADAALIAMALPDRPIRVQWMREQENLWEPYSSAMLMKLEAGIDTTNRLQNWNYELWSTPHNERIVNAGRLLPAWLLSTPFLPAPSVPISQPEGDGDRNSMPLYDVVNAQVNMHFVVKMPFRTSAMRSLGAHANIFAIESAMDELAMQANMDPLAFRLQQLADPRAIAVIQRVAREFNWPNNAGGEGGGIGFAFSRYKNLMGYCAIAVQIHVQRQTGEITIDRVVSAVDCGQIVNPDGLRNQVEGGIVQSASWTLYEEVLYDSNGVRSFDWSGYPILRFSGVPTVVDVHLLDQPGQPFLGAAEIAQGPMAAALGNALAHATGKRLLNLPLARRGWQASLS